MVQYDVKRVTKGAENFMVSFDFAKTPITQVADYIIIAASKSGTSDIHFDPRDEGMMVRFRIDGDCQDYTYIPKAYERNLTTRLKLLANMNITETRLPQDGAIKGQFGDTYLDMRVACLPTNQGEKIVIRILDYTRSLQGIDSLGFHPKNLEKIHHMMGVPNGIILVTGATGSGKSTTTYSMLSALNKPEVNVITVEDPVEMNIEGINQVQVNAEIGMTFAAALRSILREDPNVILIGEIRDSETAQIAVRASITGHLVMSTLHTNNALATVERLLDMDVERYLLSTALTGIISQRLAKQLCQDCKVQREPTKYEKKIYKKFLHQDVSLVWDANPKGCDNCRKGYKGRIAVHEVLLLDDKIRNALNDEKMSKDDFAKMIYSGSTISMLQDALIKSLEGQTSFEEVYKTIEIENEDEDNYAAELEGVEIRQVTEEVKEEIQTEEDFMGEDNTQNSNLAAKYEIPGVTSAAEAEQTEEQQTEVPVEQQVTEEQTTPPEEESTVQITEAPAFDQNMEMSEAPAIDQNSDTVETTPIEVQQTETAEEQAIETTYEQIEVPVEEITQPTEQIETLTDTPLAEGQEIVDNNYVQPEEAYAIRTTYVEADELQNQSQVAEQIENTEEVQPEESYTIKTTYVEADELQNQAQTQEIVEHLPEERATDYVSPTPEQIGEENTIQSLDTNNVENEYELPDVSTTPVTENDQIQQEQIEYEMPQVNIEQPQEFTEVTQSTKETSEFTMPQVNEIQNEEYVEEVAETDQTNLGYRIVMPNEENNSEETTEETENTESDNYEDIETSQEENNYTESTVDAEEETAPTTLDQLVEEVSEEDTVEEETEEPKEKYTVSAREDEHKNDNKEEMVDSSLAPIVDEDDDKEEESEENDNAKYQKSNEIYYDEDPIDLTIDIKTDLDKLVMSKINLEKLDMTQEDVEPNDNIEENIEEQSEEQIETTNDAAVETSEDNSNATQEEPTEEYNNTVLEIPGSTSNNQQNEQMENETTALEIPGTSSTNEEKETSEEQQSTETTKETKPDDNDDYEYDYEYDDEYDDYDFDKDDTDYTNEEQIFFNEQTISAIPNVTDIKEDEEHTGSSILTDPGIRIADDGSINQSANINADPILPNYED